MQKTEQLIGTVEIFQDLTENELKIISNLMNEIIINTGEVLFHQNDEGETLYIVSAGTISISVELTDGEKLEISEIGAGNFFGEMSIFEEAPRSATCSAKENTTLLSLDKKDFYSLMDQHPGLATRVMYRMLNITTQRLRNTGNFLADMVQFGDQARQRAVTDEMTGLYNRRFLEDALEDKLSRAKMKKEPLSVAMVDLDHFGTLNSEYGEQTGNEIILAATDVFRSVLSDKAVLIRYGGDEFTFILYGAGSVTAMELCGRVCSELRKLDILKNRQGKINSVTSSIGIAAYPEHADSSAVLMEKADSALYRAKEGGRDRTALPGTS